MSKKYFYMAVTPDEYELPLFIADTADEMAERYGLKKHTIFNSICGNKKGVKLGARFVKVKYEL